MKSTYYQLNLNLLVRIFKRQNFSINERAYHKSISKTKIPLFSEARNVIGQYFLFLAKFLCMHTRYRLTPLITLLLFGSMTLKGQDTTKVSVPKRLDSDLLATVMGDTLKVSVRKVDDENVTFSLLGERMKQRIQKSTLTAILYKDGRIVSFPNPLILKKSSEGASKIRVTYSEEDVQVYKQMALVEGRYVGSYRYVYSNDFLVRMAIQNLKEIAYQNDPRVKILLIKKVDCTRGYGEDPSAIVLAEAYTR